MGETDEGGVGEGVVLSEGVNAGGGKPYPS